MTPFGRWALVALAVLLVVATPVVVAVWPTTDSYISAADLLDEITAAEDHPWSGYVETRGVLELPVADDFADVGALFSGRTRMRAWWRAADDWRVDRLEAAGEIDVVHQGRMTTVWDYESQRARVSTDPQIRLPRTADLVPPVLAARVLHGVDATQVSRVPARRITGTAAPGLRVRPEAPQSSIDHVDLWADPESGVVLRVAVYGDGDDAPSFTTELREFSSATPDASLTAFDPAGDAEVSYEPVLDIADAANQFALVRPPQRIGGLPRSPASDRAVGVYGAGITELMAIPLREQEAEPLREQLRSTPGVRRLVAGTLVTAGPLGVLLTGRCREDGWLLTGTVTAATLVVAAGDLP